MKTFKVQISISFCNNTKLQCLVKIEIPVSIFAQQKGDPISQGPRELSYWTQNLKYELGALYLIRCSFSLDAILWLVKNHKRVLLSSLYSCLLRVKLLAMSQTHCNLSDNEWGLLWVYKNWDNDKSQNLTQLIRTKSCIANIIIIFIFKVAIVGPWMYKK